jgi:acetone carboxylase gamma subunit
MRALLILMLMVSCSSKKYVPVQSAKIVGYDRDWCGRNLSCKAYIAVDDGSDKLKECYINNDMLDNRHHIGYDEINKQCLLLKKVDDKY